MRLKLKTVLLTVIIGVLVITGCYFILKVVPTQEEVVSVFDMLNTVVES